jgi:glycosyltransferase involved in cell wall biosynthesis
MPNQPVISVIMAVYNAEKYLVEALESVLTQSFTNFEFLIHNDGSADYSYKILEQYAVNDKRIILSSNENQGLAASLNTLIRKARGEFVARMDADDICLSNRFEKQIYYLNHNFSCSVIVGSYLMIDSKNRPIDIVQMPINNYEIDRNNLHGCVSIAHPTAIIRKEVFDKVGLYDDDNHAAEDLDLWLRIAEHGELANLQDVVLKYRIHDKSISSSKRDLQREMVHKSCEAAWERRGLTGMICDDSDWRMVDRPDSRRKFYLSYGWRAWNNGYRNTWRHYAWRSVALAPLSRKAWTLLIAGALKRPVRHAEPSA